MEDWTRIRYLYQSEGLSRRQIAKELGISRDTVARALAASSPPKYQPRPAVDSRWSEVEPAVRALLGEFCDIPATVIAQRVGWQGSASWLRENVSRIRPEFRRVDSVDTDRNPLPTEKKHLLSTPDGDYPLEQKTAKNRWERATIKHEGSLGTLRGWYRNPSAAGKNSLRIAHKSADGWKSVQPDFIFVHSTGDDLRPSIIDPHGAHLGDSGPKLKALAKYADEHRDRFDRIIAVGVEKDGDLYGLDLKSPRIRQAVYEAQPDSDTIKRLYAEHGT